MNSWNWWKTWSSHYISICQRPYSHLIQLHLFHRKWSLPKNEVIYCTNLANIAEGPNMSNPCRHTCFIWNTAGQKPCSEALVNICITMHILAGPHVQHLAPLRQWNDRILVNSLQICQKLYAPWSVILPRQSPASLSRKIWRDRQCPNPIYENSVPNSPNCLPTTLSLGSELSCCWKISPSVDGGATYVCWSSVEISEHSVPSTC